jgi:predicted metal-dependent hydrolase
MSLAQPRPALRQYQLTASGIDASVTHKRVRNLTISVHRDGRVRVTAPARASTGDVERAIGARIDWIRRIQARFAQQRPPRILEYVTGELHRFRGADLELSVLQRPGNSEVRLRDDRVIELHVNGESGIEDRRRAIERWYRHQLFALLPEVVSPWATRMGVQPVEWRIRRMRTRWGTCNTRARRIWLNLELITLPHECLEYIAVHELTHLLEASHNYRFRSLMDTFLPDWRRRRQALNREGAHRLREG